jgi:hypothetical protein
MIPSLVIGTWFDPCTQYSLACSNLEKIILPPPLSARGHPRPSVTPTPLPHACQLIILQSIYFVYINPRA